MADEATPAVADEPVTPAPPAEEPKKEETPEKETPEDAPSKEPEKPSETPPEPTEPPPEETPQEKPDEPPTEEEPKAQTRKERREERKRYYDSIRSENAGPPVAPPQTEYKPLDYTQAVDDQGYLDTKKAEEDRQNAARAAAEQASYNARMVADRNNFNRQLEVERGAVEAEFPVLREGSDEYDEDLAEEVYDRFKTVVGYQDPVVDSTTGQTLRDWSVNRTDVSLKNFVKAELAWLNRYAEERVDQAAKNTASQKATQGARPSGTNRAVDISDLSKLSAEDIKKNEARINEYVKSLPTR